MMISINEQATRFIRTLIICVGCFLTTLASALDNTPDIPSAGVRAFGSEQVSARIAQGDPVVNLREFEWMASLRSDSGVTFCGGVVIDQYHLLTAGHCVAQFAPNRFRAFVGEQEYPVSRVWISNEFHWSLLRRDIAVVRLASPVAVEAIAIATTLDELQLQDGDPLTVLGYGHSSDQDTTPNPLARGEVPFSTAQSCAQRWRTNFPTLATMIEQQGICASGLGSVIDTCKGDSGGPLLLYRTGAWYLLGLTSFGEATCGSAQKPGVYASVSQFSESIDKALRSEAYYGNWTQVLVGNDPLESELVFQITNDSTIPWQFEGVTGEQAPFQLNPLSTCPGLLLAPQQSCLLRVQFNPVNGGFFTDRLLLNRQQQSPIWIDLQGFAFEFVPASYFGEQNVFAFTGGESLAQIVQGGGVSSGGHLVWQNMPGIEVAETYIGTNESQEVTLFFDFEQQAGDDQLPNIEVRKLSAYGELIPIALDRDEGWQAQKISLDADDFIYIRIQAPGRGMNGRLRFDVVAQSDAALGDIELQLPAANQAATSQDPVMLESGGSLDLISLIVLGLMLGRCRKIVTSLPV